MPTYTSIVIINLPKISVFVFIFNFLHYTVNITQISEVQIFVIITCLCSLIMGTVAGLIQTKIKRLLAFSTISHVGFLLIAVIIGTSALSSLNALIFYIIQYTMITILAFLCLIAFNNFHFNVKSLLSPASGVDNIVDLQGFGQKYKVLTMTFVLCLFSIAGIPPLTGFYAKLEILNSSIFTNHPMIFLTAVACSVISASYYLKIIKVVIFDEPDKNSDISHVLVQGNNNVTHMMNISALHSYSIAVLTAFLTLFILDPKLIINSTELLALSVFII